MAIACMAGLAVLFGAVLVSLEVTGTITWSGRVPGAAFEVTSTHVGVCFALVGMTVHIFMILKPSKYSKVTKTKMGYSPDKLLWDPPKLGGSAATEAQGCPWEVLAKPPTLSGFPENGHFAMWKHLLAISGLPENERFAVMKRLLALSSLPEGERSALLKHLPPLSGLPENERPELKKQLLALSSLPEGERSELLKELLRRSGSGHFWVETETKTTASSSPITGGR